MERAVVNTLEFQGVSVQIEGRNLLQDINLTLKPGEVVSVLGPNGAGKSTLMKVISGERKPSSGDVLLNGRNDWPLNHQALMLGVLPQSSSLSFPFTVEEVVLLGRIPCASHHDENLMITREALRKLMAYTLKIAITPPCPVVSASVFIWHGFWHRSGMKALMASVICYLMSLRRHWIQPISS